MKTKKQYTAPELTVVTFKVEQGYALSSVTKVDLFGGTGIMDQYNAFGQQHWADNGSGTGIMGDLFGNW